MNFAEFLVECARRKEAHSSWRMGQTYFNVLKEVKPAFAETIRGTFLDPFHNDNRIGDFLSHVYANWTSV